MKDEIIRDDPVMNDVIARLNSRNQNWLCLIFGGVGSGKSYSAISIGQYIDDDFSIDQVVFTAKELVQLVRGRTLKLKRGSAIILDEAGISFASRNFQSKENKRISSILQTFRALNYALIITVPQLSFIDKQGRMLLHTMIETQSINRERQTCKVKWKHVKPHYKTQEPIGIFPRIKNPETGMISVTPFVNIAKPDTNIIRKYERKKRKFIADLLADADAMFSDGTETVGKKDESNPNVICRKCGRKWRTTSVAILPTCPSCRSKSTIRLDKSPITKTKQRLPSLT